MWGSKRGGTGVASPCPSRRTRRCVQKARDRLRWRGTGLDHKGPGLEGTVAAHATLTDSRRVDQANTPTCANADNRHYVKLSRWTEGDPYPLSEGPQVVAASVRRS